MKVKTQLIVAFLMVMVGMLGGTGFSLIQMDKVFTATNFTNINSVPSVVTLDRALNELAAIRVMTWQYLAVHDEVKLNEIERKIDLARDKLMEELKIYEATMVADEQDGRMLKADRAALVAYDAVRAKVTAFVKEEKI
ncbi:MAG: MCP four helix bundle domain-containing protein, partial [Candidatus Methylumidiphilus sp.]